MDSNMSILQGQLTYFKRSKVHDLFESVALLNPNKEALIYEENNKSRIHTFQEINNLSSRLAKIIIQTVVENGLYNSDKDENFIIGVHMPPSDYLVITLLAIWKAGASYLPLDPSYPHDRIKYIISDTKPALVIYIQENGNFLNTFKLCIKDLISSDQNVKLFETKEIFPLQVKNDSSVVLYTSGSTGHPKGVCLSHTTILNRLRWQYKNFPFKSNENVCVFKTAFTFVDSIFEIWGPLLKGRAVLVLPKQTVQNPEKLIQSLEKHKIQRIVLVPSLLESIILYKEVSGRKIILPDLNLWISSGEILSKTLVNKFYCHFKVGKNILCNFFGSTEVVDFTYHSITHPNQLDKYDSFPLGVAVDNTQVYILDANKNILPEGEVGEIYVSGLNLPLNYISKNNQDKIINNDLCPTDKFSKLCKTGDVGQIKHNLLFFLGRTDSVIKIRGFRVDLIEIEKVINLIEGVGKCVVLCYKPRDMNQSILAFVQNTDAVQKHEIEEIVKAKLPIYMVPKVICIESFPLLINGKVDRQLLLSNYDENKSTNGIDYTGVPEELMSSAKILFEIVASFATGGSELKIGLKSNFFEIGGNSLNCIYTVMTLKRNGYNIGINDFVKSANLKEVLNKIVVSIEGKSFMSDQSTDYIIEQMKEQHKDEVFEIIASSFVEKSNVESLIEGITKESYYEFLEYVWPATIRDEISFVVKSTDGSIIAASVNFNADTKFNYTLKSSLSIVDDFFVFLEEPIKEKLLKKYKRICCSSLLATKKTLTQQENVLLVHFIEQQIIKLAKNRKYDGILTSNQISITEDIGTMFGYISYLDYQINQYVTKDNIKPFRKAPDSQKVIIHFKKL